MCTCAAGIRTISTQENDAKAVAYRLFITSGVLTEITYEVSAQPVSLTQQTDVFLIVLSDVGRSGTPSRNENGCCLIGFFQILCDVILFYELG